MIETLVTMNFLMPSSLTCIEIIPTASMMITNVCLNADSGLLLLMLTFHVENLHQTG